MITIDVSAHATLVRLAAIGLFAFGAAVQGCAEKRAWQYHYAHDPAHQEWLDPQPGRPAGPQVRCSEYQPARSSPTADSSK